MRSVRRLAAMFLWITLSAPAADRTKALEAQIAQRDRTIMDIRTQLEVARAQADNRVDAIRSSYQSLNRELRVQLDQSRSEVSAARSANSSKDALLRELTAQLEQQRREAVEP